MAGGIVVDGKIWPLIVDPELPIPFPVIGPETHGIRFAPGEGHNRHRREKIRAVVWHWTGGEADPMRMAAVLKRRGYGVEFAVDRYGGIYQFADPARVDTADVGGFNSPSVGVEVVNYGFRRISPRDWQLRQGNWLRIPKAGRGRRTYEATIHGRTLTLARFFPYQLTACMQLARTLSAALDIPPFVQTGGSLLSAKRLAVFRGHLGHLHVSERKLDPGLDLLEYMARRFATETRNA